MFQLAGKLPRSFFFPQQDAKNDPVREEEARDWLQAVVGEPFPEGTFHEALKDGIYLCKAIQALDPSIKIKVNTSKMAFKMVSFARNQSRPAKLDAGSMRMGNTCVIALSISDIACFHCVYCRVPYIRL